jgi:hypothetical protein
MKNKRILLNIHFYSSNIETLCMIFFYDLSIYKLNHLYIKINFIGSVKVSIDYKLTIYY